MSYCSIEEAYGKNSQISNNIGNYNTHSYSGVENSLYSPNLDESINLKGKYKYKNEFTRNVHNNRTRQKRVKKKDVYKNKDNISVSSLLNERNKLQYIDPLNELGSELPYYNLEEENNMLNNQLKESMPPFGGLDEEPSMNFPNAGQNINHMTKHNNEYDRDLSQNVSEYVENYKATNVLKMSENNNSNNTNNINSNNEQNLDNQSMIVNESNNTLEEEVKYSNKSSCNDINEKLTFIMKKLEMLENKITKTQSNNVHDLILFVIMGLFILFILDSIFRIGRMTL